ncbi:hypothetical protein [Methylococcus capsulatus]
MAATARDACPEFHRAPVTTPDAYHDRSAWAVGAVFSGGAGD